MPPEVVPAFPAAAIYTPVSAKIQVNQWLI
jgi:hypothetical protein